MKQRVFPLRIGVQSVCRILNVDPGAMLERAGLPRGLADDDDACVTAEEFFRCWQAVEALTNVTDPGFVVGQAIANSPPPPEFLAVTCAPNFVIGQQRLANYKLLLGPITSDAVIDDGTFTVTYRSVDPVAPLPPGIALSHVVFSVVVIRNLTAREIQPLHVELRGASDLSAAAVSLFGENIYESRDLEARISFALKDAERPFISENARTWRSIEAGLRSQLKDLHYKTPFRAIVREKLIEALPRGSVSAAQLCQEMGISQSTFRRRLKREGATYQELLDAIRTELAQRYLSETSVKMSELSFMLGYTDPNSFFRSFKRTSGKTPLAFRQSAK